MTFSMRSGLVLSVLAMMLAQASAQEAPAGPDNPFGLDSSGAPSMAADEQEQLRLRLEKAAMNDDQTRRSLEELAGSLERRKLWSDAGLVYRHIIDTYGSTPSLQFKSGQMLAYAGEYDACVLVMRDLLDEVPEHTDGALLLARVYAWQGQFDQTKALVEAIRTREPDNLDIVLLTADMLYWQKRFPEAERQYDRYLYDRPEDPHALRATARNYLALGDFERAERMTGALENVGDTETIQQIADAQSPAVEHPFRVDLAYTFFLNLDRQDWHGVVGAFSYALSNAVSLGLSAELQYRADLPGGDSDVMLTLFGGFKPADWLTIEADVGFTPEPDFRPSFRMHLQPTFRLADFMDAYIYYTLWTFGDAVAVGDSLWINQVGPGLIFHMGPVDLDLSYRASVFDDADVGHLGVLHVDWRVIDELRLFAGASYGKGVEVFFDPSAIIQDSMTVLGGAGWDFHPQHGVNLTWAYLTTDPDRDNKPVVGLFQHSLTAHYHVRF